MPPDRDSFSATETAEAKATLETTIIHPDSSTSPGGKLRVRSACIRTTTPRSGRECFANFADVEFLGANNSTVSLFDSFKDNGDRFNPRFSLDSVSTNVKLGTLQPGDTVSYVYKLTAQGTTHGGEQGYVAFLGDPFGLDVTSGNLILEHDVRARARDVDAHRHRTGRRHSGSRPPHRVTGLRLFRASAGLPTEGWCWRSACAGHQVAGEKRPVLLPTFLFASLLSL